MCLLRGRDGGRRVERVSGDGTMGGGTEGVDYGLIVCLGVDCGGSCSRGCRTSRNIVETGIFVVIRCFVLPSLGMVLRAHGLC